MLASREGHLEVVKYLLTSKELIEAGHTFADVHVHKDEVFKWAHEENHEDLIRWLIMEYGIEKTPRIEEIINIDPVPNEYFRVREEFNDLKLTMNANENEIQKTNDESQEEEVRKSVKIKKL